MKTDAYKKTISNAQQSWKTMTESVIYPPIKSQYDFDEASKMLLEELSRVGKSIVEYLRVEQNIPEENKKFCMETIESLATGVYPLCRKLLLVARRKGFTESAIKSYWKVRKSVDKNDTTC